MKKLISIILIFIIVAAIGCSKETGHKVGKETRKENLTSSINMGLHEPDTITTKEMAIGGIYYEQPLSEVFAKFGQPVYTRKGAPRGMCYKFVSNGTKFDLSASDDEKHKGIVMSMEINGNIKLATSKGIKVGSTYDEVIKAYGQPTVKNDGLSYRIRFHRNPKQYDYYGYLNFDFDNNQRVVRIKFGTVDMSS